MFLFTLKASSLEFSNDKEFLTNQEILEKKQFLKEFGCKIFKQKAYCSEYFLSQINILKLILNQDIIIAYLLEEFKYTDNLIDKLLQKYTKNNASINQYFRYHEFDEESLNLYKKQNPKKALAILKRIITKYSSFVIEEFKNEKFNKQDLKMTEDDKLFENNLDKYLENNSDIQEWCQNSMTIKNILLENEETKQKILEYKFLDSLFLNSEVQTYIKHFIDGKVVQLYGDLKNMNEKYQDLKKQIEDLTNFNNKTEHFGNKTNKVNYDENFGNKQILNDEILAKQLQQKENDHQMALQLQEQNNDQNGKILFCGDINKSNKNSQFPFPIIDFNENIKKSEINNKLTEKEQQELDDEKAAQQLQRFFDKEYSQENNQKDPDKTNSKNSQRNGNIVCLGDIPNQENNNKYDPNQTNSFGCLDSLDNIPSEDERNNNMEQFLNLNNIENNYNNNIEEFFNLGNIFFKNRNIDNNIEQERDPLNQTIYNEDDIKQGLDDDLNLSDDSKKSLKELYKGLYLNKNNQNMTNMKKEKGFLNQTIYNEDDFGANYNNNKSFKEKFEKCFDYEIKKQKKVDQKQRDLINKINNPKQENKDIEEPFETIYKKLHINEECDQNKNQKKDEVYGKITKKDLLDEFF